MDATQPPAEPTPDEPDPSTATMSQDAQKQAAGEAAVDEVRSGMTVGLGTGSTAVHAVREIGRRITDGSLTGVVGVPTSRATAEVALEVGIPIVDLEGRLDVCIDGADEISRGGLHMTKGGGGALLREKIVGAASDRYITVVDDAKVVDRLGSQFSIPIEVARFGVDSTIERLAEFGGPQLRERLERTFVTDNGNYIVDLDVAPIEDPAVFEAAVAVIPGVMEIGLFVAMADVALVGTPNGVTRMEPLR